MLIKHAGFLFAIFFLLLQLESLTLCTVNFTHRVGINSEERGNLWQREISPHLRKLPLREYIIDKLNITEDATEHEFKTKTTLFGLK